MTTDLMQSWFIRKYENGDETEIISLHNSVFKSSTDLKHWTWKYKGNPKGFMSYVAEDKKEGIVGHYGLIFTKMKIEGKIIVGSQAVDAITHPNFQRQGMFVKLGKEILQEAGDEGIFFTFGFPNEPALPGHRRVGWVEICNVPILVKPLNIENILRKYIKNNFLLKVGSQTADIFLRVHGQDRKAQMEYLSLNSVICFDERVNEFWSKVSDDYCVIQVRDKDFLNWRYVENPDKQYTIYTAEKNEALVGYIILSELGEYGMRGGSIVDMLTYSDHGQISECLISKAVEHFKGKKVDYVACLMRQGSIYYEALRKHGFVTSPKRVRFIVHANSDEFYKLSANFFDKWFFTWGDSDFM